MMLIRKIAFGDKNEAFVESRLTNGLNIIFSDDNNRGKTLVMQGLMYSLGYDSIFPSTFNYKEKYFYSEVEIDNRKYEFLRKKNSLLMKTNDSIELFNSVTELKYFFDKYIFPVPKILKDNRKVLVDLSLFHELFFVGQDNRNPSGLISRGQFNKNDFKNMVYSLSGLVFDGLEIADISTIKEKIKELGISLKEVRKKVSIIKLNPKIAEVFSKSFDLERMQKKANSIKLLNEQMSKLRRDRQREINRKTKLEQLISELNSLNRELSVGEVKCGDCGSQNVIYTNKDLKFDISNRDVRNNILNSISGNIKQKAELIEEYSREINSHQAYICEEMSDTPPDFSQLILYQEQVSSDKNYDDEAFSISQQIETLKSKLNASMLVSDTVRNKIKLLDQNIIEHMGELYRSIDPNGNLEFKDIFAKRDSTFSGSESQEFYFCKVVALSLVLNHNFPIIIDSFRDGELSSVKEEKMLGLYAKLGNQIILTSTLKKEEYTTEKYNKYGRINAIDYSSHQDCKILTESSGEQFSAILARFNGLVV